VRAFLLYTAARIGLFALCWVVVSAVAGIWLDWSMLTALWTALIALALSAVLALVLLRPLRDQLATAVAGRAGRARQRFEAARGKEDDDS
jgi:hypothetical protein